MARWLGMCVVLSLAAASVRSSGAVQHSARMRNAACGVVVDRVGGVEVAITAGAGEVYRLRLAPSIVAGDATSQVSQAGGGVLLSLRDCKGSASLQIGLLSDGCRLQVQHPTPGWRGLTGTVLEAADPLYAARVTLEGQRKPTVHGGGDILLTAAGRACNRNANAVYSARTFRGVLLDSGDASPDLRLISAGYSFRLAEGQLSLRALDTWPLIGWRPADAGYTFGHPEGLKDHVVPREWMANHRPFPWRSLSPVQLPFISITDPADYDRVRQQVDFLAANLRDWGFCTFGEWPLTQCNPEYDPVRKRAYLEGNRRTAEYAHSKGIKILRWVTDPDIDPSIYPGLHADFTKRNWFADEKGMGEWLLDYTSPGVQQWVEKQYADLGAAGPDFYWVDNNRPTKPKMQPDRFPPDAFREFYLAIQRGLLSTGRSDILIRSGASAWADYAAAGILDVYAPGPDVQNDWTEQQVAVAQELARRDYLCHWNLWRRSIDDFFAAGPQTLDETRAMATLLGVTGLSFTTTDIGFPNIPPERLMLVRQLVPVPAIRPMDLCRFERGPLPRWWLLNQMDDDVPFQVAGVFNWEIKAEETHYVSFEDLGLDPTSEYLVYDVWSQEPVGWFRGGIGCRLAPRSGRALAIHPIGDRPFIVATNRHVDAGAAELANRHWDVASGVLSADFVAGVKGQTFQMTVFAPVGWRPVRATVDGREQSVAALGDGLWRVAVPCTGDKAQVRVFFSVDRERGATASPCAAPSRRDEAALGHRRPTAGARTVDLGDSSALRQLLGGVPSILQEARAGKAVVLISPLVWSGDLERLQRELDLHWGLFRVPGDAARWLLAVSSGQAAASDDIMLRATCVSFAANTAQALLKPVGLGVIAVVRPSDGTGTWRYLLERVASRPSLALSRTRQADDDASAAVTSTVGPFTVAEGRSEGTAGIHVSRALRGHALSLHFRRLTYSLIGDYWAVPRINVFINGKELPHRYNPCRPESPPQGWDSLYFSIPKGVLRFDGTDRVTIRSAVPAKDAAALAADLQTALELGIEDPAVIGRTELVALPDVAVVPPPSLDALLGLDGGVRYLARGGGADLELTGGTPFNGWPQKPGGVTHCVFDNRSFSVIIHVPKGLEGVLEVFAYDSDVYRKEEITFEGRAAVPVEAFGAGKWLSFPFTSSETPDGRLRLTVRNVSGANCVLSRVRLMPLGGH